MRSIYTFVAMIGCAISFGFSKAQDSPRQEESRSSLSPDKKWECSGGDTPKLVKAATNEIALEFSEECDLGALGEHSTCIWAPDSRRFAFYSCGAGKEHLTLVYQLRDDRWIALKTIAQKIL